MKSILTLAVFFIGSASYAGDNGGGYLKCRSASGKTRVEGHAGVDYNGTGPAQLNYSIEASSILFNTEKPLAPETHLIDYVVFRHGKSYAVGFKRSYVKGAQGYQYSDNLFQLQSIANSMKEDQADLFHFHAIIPAYTSLDPRKNSDFNAESLEWFDKDIQVSCQLDLRL